MAKVYLGMTLNILHHEHIKNAFKNKHALRYDSRTDFGGSVVCQLGEVHMGRTLGGKILSILEIT